MARPTGPQRNKRHPKRRRGEPDKPSANRVRGTVRMNGDGSAKLLAETKGTPNVYLPPEEIVGVRDGDVVTVELGVGRKGRVRGRIVERGKERTGTVVGVLRRQARFTYLLPDDGSSALVVPADEMGTARDGDAVQARILREGDTEGSSIARVEEVLGDPADPKVQVEMAVRATKWPREFDPAVITEVSLFPDIVPERVLVDGRRDLRGVPHVTIDGEDARDFDDAVSARLEGDRYRVWVSIADVSHYVVEGTALDDAARERATSVYFPDRVLPMLPEGLSNELCSLKPNVPRLTMTCEMLVDKDGGVHDVDVYPSLIESEARLTYTIVQDVLNIAETGEKPRHPQAELIQKLVIPARWLRAQRQKRGAIDFEIPESRIKIEDGVAVDIVMRERVEAHRLIEDLMVAANEAVAEYLIQRNWPALFRVHEPPDPVKLDLLVRWASKLGIELDPGEAREPKYLQRFLFRVRNHPAISVVQSLVLRMMSQARYGPENRGHYGLASKAYAHFTSPIRRYPDLVVHRALRAFWRKEGELQHLDALGDHCSQRERKAMEGERGVTQLMACQVAQHHVGEEMQATVVGVHQAGAFVRPDTLFVDGLIPMEALSTFYRGYYEYIEDEQMLFARRTKHRIKLGDKIDVLLANVNMKRRQIDFAPSEGEAESRPRKRTAHVGKPQGTPERSRQTFERPRRDDEAPARRPRRDDEVAASRTPGGATGSRRADRADGKSRWVTAEAPRKSKSANTDFEQHTGRFGDRPAYARKREREEAIHEEARAKDGGRGARDDFRGPTTYPKKSDRFARDDFRGSKGSDRSAHDAPRERDGFRGPKGGDRGADLGGAQGDIRGPRTDEREARFDSRGPKSDIRGPRTDERESRLDSRGPKSEASESRPRPRSWEEQYLGAPSDPSPPRRFEEMRERAPAAGGADEPRRGKRPGRFGVTATTESADGSGRPRRNKIAPRAGKERSGNRTDPGGRSGGKSGRGGPRGKR